MRDPDTNNFNLDEDGERDDSDYSDCVNDTTRIEEDGEDDS